MNTCKVCQNQNPPDARICLKCGSVFEPSHSGSERANFFKLLGIVVVGLAIVLTAIFWRATQLDLTYFGTDLIAAGVLSTPPDYRGKKVYMERVDAQVKDGFVQVPLQTILDSKLVRFHYQTSTRDIALMAYVGPTGRLITAFALCEPSKNISYHFDSNTLVNDKCGTSWALEGSGPNPGPRPAHLGLGGSCPCKHFGPEFVDHELVNGMVRIPERLVQSWTDRQS